VLCYVSWDYRRGLWICTFGADVVSCVGNLSYTLLGLVFERERKAMEWSLVFIVRSEFIQNEGYAVRELLSVIIWSGWMYLWHWTGLSRFVEGCF